MALLLARYGSTRFPTPIPVFVRVGQALNAPTACLITMGFQLISDRSDDLFEIRWLLIHFFEFVIHLGDRAVDDGWGCQSQFALCPPVLIRPRMSMPSGSGANLLASLRLEVRKGGAKRSELTFSRKGDHTKNGRSVLS
jgi:hypothetical protein